MYERMYVFESACCVVSITPNDSMTVKQEGRASSVDKVVLGSPPLGGAGAIPRESAHPLAQ